MTKGVIPKMLRLVTVKPTVSEKDTTVLNIDGTVMNVFNAQIIRALSQGFGIPFQIIMAPGDTFGRKVSNGTWNGAIGMLVKEEADLTVSGLTMNKERREVVNFCYPMYISDVSFVTNKPEPYPKKFAIFDVYFFKVWVGIGICLILVSYTLCMLLNKRKTYPTILVDTLGTLLEKSYSYNVRYKRTVSLLITWFLATLILANSYKAVILSVMTFPRMVGIRDITDLAKAAKEKTIKCISYKGGYPSVPWLEANDDRLKSIEECRRRTEIEGIHGQGGFRRYRNKKAFISDRLDLITYKRDYFVSDNSFIVSYLGIAYSKKFCCTRKLERVVRRIVEADLYAKTLRDRETVAQIRMSRPKFPTNERAPISALTLEDFTGAFTVLSIGYMFSLLVFIVEILRKHPGKFADDIQKDSGYDVNIVVKSTHTVDKRKDIVEKHF